MILHRLMAFASPATGHYRYEDLGRGVTACGLVGKPAALREWNEEVTCPDCIRLIDGKDVPPWGLRKGPAYQIGP